MKDNEKVSFTITDRKGSTKGFRKGAYCFKNDVTHVYVFYSALEQGWVFILLNGWIKINGRIVTNVPFFVTSKCTIDFDNRRYYFESHVDTKESASKTISDAISNADNKDIDKAHIKFFLRDIQEIENVDAYYEILSYNPIFVKDKDNIWTLDYHIYGVNRHFLIEACLYREFEYLLEINTTFEILDIKDLYGIEFWDSEFLDIESNSSGVSCKSFTDATNYEYDYIINGRVYYLGNMVSLVEYMYHNIKDYFVPVNIDINSNSPFEIYKLWIQKFCKTKLEWESKKRNLETAEDYIIKKRCIYIEDNQERVEKICTTVVYKEIEQLRNCFTDIESCKRHKKRNKTKRSHSLVEDRGDDDKFWMFKKSHDI